MVRHGNQRKWAGQRMVRKSGSICLKSVDGCVGRNIPAEWAEPRRSYIIYRTDDMNSGGLDTERPQYFWIPMIICRNDILAVNNNGWNFNQTNWVPNDCWYVFNVNVDGASMILI
jgi:hypothetical protein